MVRYIAASLILLGVQLGAASGVLAREGGGSLRRRGSLLLLHVKGTPYQMGYQHGALLRDHIRALYSAALKDLGARQIRIPGSAATVRIHDVIWQLFQAQRPFYRERFLQEMAGLAAGARLSLREVCTANHLPELFHCSGFALLGRATKGGEVLHGRVLDYMTGAHLQEHAVVIIAEPEGRNAFVNVSFAGFVGSVTGMNERHIAVGEMGGGGQLFWAGEPMSFLVRRVLEEADSLSEALEIFRKAPRTCEYYYVVSDGLRRQAAGLAATWQDLFVIRPGQYHPLLPEPVPDCVILSAGERYKHLVQRIRKGYGSFTRAKAIGLMAAPVAMRENLHNALMVPRSGDLSVAYAGADGAPAWKERYCHLNLFKLLRRTPKGTAVVSTAPQPEVRTKEQGP